jgi:hypothetical protein
MMKKTASIFLMTLALLCAFSIVSCDWFIPVDVYQGDSARFIVEPSTGANGYDIEYSYTTGSHDYYFLYLGTVKGVPISYGTAVEYKGSDINLTYTKSNTTISSIETSNSTSIEQSIETGTMSEIESSLTATANIGSDLFGVSAGIETGYRELSQRSESKTSGHSTTDTFTSHQEWQSTSSEELSFSLSKGEKGFYRYTNFANCDIYAAIIKDTNSGELYYEISNFAREDSYFAALDYSITREGLNRGIDSSKIDFDVNSLASLPPPGTGNNGTTLSKNYASEPNGKDLGEVIISPNVNNANFSGNASNEYVLNIVIAARNNDLTITFNDMKFKAPNGTDAINDADATNKHTIKLVLRGTNSVTGGTGVDGPLFPNSNEKRGQKSITSNGGIGGIAINIGTNNLIVTGSPSDTLTVSGGKGGNSGYKNGNLVYATGSWDWFFDPPGPFNAINGGNGGIGIIGDTLDFTNALGNIDVNGGNGGNASTGVYYFFQDPIDRLFTGTAGAGGVAFTGTKQDSTPRPGPITAQNGTKGKADWPALW